MAQSTIQSKNQGNWKSRGVKLGGGRGEALDKILKRGDTQYRRGLHKIGTLCLLWYILLNILRCKSNQTLKFGLLPDKNMRNIFLQTIRRTWGRETSSERLCFVFFLKSYEVKGKQVSTTFILYQYILVVTDLANKNLFVLYFRLLVQRHAQLWFFRKESGTSFSTALCVWFF